MTQDIKAIEKKVIKSKIAEMRSRSNSPSQEPLKKTSNEIFPPRYIIKSLESGIQVYFDQFKLIEDVKEMKKSSKFVVQQYINQKGGKSSLIRLYRDANQIYKSEVITNNSSIHEN